MKIKVKRIKHGDFMVDFPKVIKKGDWVDLRTAEKVVLNAPQAGTLKGSEVKHRDVTSEVTLIPLGIAMKLPEGFEAIIAPRSSVPMKIGVTCANSIGIIDNAYCSDSDEWMMPVTTLRKVSIEANTRICQFRIQLSQKATFWQKLKWLFSSGIEFEEVDSLGGEARGGLGEGTGYGSL